MSENSKTFLECCKAVENAKNHDEIMAAVDVLDNEWQLDNTIMADKDWHKLTNVISKAAQKLKDGCKA